MGKFSKEIQIALVAIVGIVVLYFGLQFLKGLTMFSSDHRYYAKFSDISGLSPSSPVFANGYRIGVVEGIVYDYENHGDIVAVLGIDKQLAVPKGSTAEIVSDLLGNIKLVVHFGPRFDEIMEVGDTISGDISQGLMGKAATLMPHVERMLPKLDSILGNINALLSDPALHNSLAHVDELTGDLTKTSKELNVLMASLNKQVPHMLQSADGALSNVDTLTHTLNRLDLETTIAKANATLSNVEQLTAQLNSPKGTVGKMLHDPAVYDNLNSTMMHLDSLMIDFKTHPWRYVHFSLFGRKKQ